MYIYIYIYIYINIYAPEPGSAPAAALAPQSERPRSLPRGVGGGGEGGEKAVGVLPWDSTFQLARKRKTPNEAFLKNLTTAYSGTQKNSRMLYGT